MASTPQPDDTPDRPTPWQTLAPLIDLVTPMAVRVAATLRLSDLVRDGPADVDTLARRSGTDPEGLARLLRHLVGHGMFTEPRPGVFAVNPAAALLDSRHPSGMQVSLDLGGFGGQMDLAFTELLHTVRTGEPSWARVFGAPFWEYLAAHPAISASFDATMAAGPEYLRDDVAGYAWPAAGRVVDVGGGTGGLLAAILGQHPRVRGTLVDLPETIARARQHLSRHGLNGRVDLVAQDFFDPLPAGGDVYVLNSVLHDWADPDALRILRRCAEAARPHGRVVLIGQHDTGDGARAEMDLRMLVLCGGRERTIEEYAVLAGRVGLAVTGVHPTPLGQVSIECAPDSSCLPGPAPTSP